MHFARQIVSRLLDDVVLAPAERWTLCESPEALDQLVARLREIRPVSERHQQVLRLAHALRWLREHREQVPVADGLWFLKMPDGWQLVGEHDTVTALMPVREAVALFESAHAVRVENDAWRTMLQGIAKDRKTACD